MATFLEFEQSRRYSSPQEEVILNLIRATDRLQRALLQRLRPHKLTPTQYNVLRILRGAYPHGLTCSNIGSRMLTPEPDITRLLARLKVSKLLQQQRDAADKRILWTKITQLGLETLAALDPLMEETPRELLHGLSREEVTELNRLLGRLLGQDSAESCEPHTPPSTRVVTAKPTSQRSPQWSLPRRHPE